MEDPWRTTTTTTITTAAADLPDFSEQPSSDSHLLRLTPPIRLRIYHYLGLASWDGRRPYRFDLHGHKASETAPKPSSFHGLLLSCRLVYAEAAALLYSANRFILYYAHAHPEPLGPLHALTTPSLAALTSLKIILNQASCQHQDEFGDYPHCCLQGREGDEWCGIHHCKTSHEDLHRPPLLGPTPEGSHASDGDGDGDDKLAAAQAVLSNGRLELGLVCDIDPHHEQALDIAMSATAPLRLLPLLKACDIRLCKTPDSRLRQVAQDGVLQACGIAAPPSNPPMLITLTTLPRELRLHILKYTDLIVPSKDVTWSRQDQGYITFSFESSSSPDHRYCRQFFHCWYNAGPRPFIGCFCRRRHAAFSFTCKCWAPPGPALFLICRTLYHDAQIVFFSGNRFIVHDYRSGPPWELPSAGQNSEGPIPSHDYPSERLAASQFLREVVPTHCLAHLRFLELVFPPYPPLAWPQVGHPAIQDWRATVEWLQDKSNAPGLTLRLVGATVSDWTPDSYSDTITASEGDTIMRAYMALLRPLRQLADNGLARFYANLVYPWQWAEGSRNSDARCVEDKGREIKEHAERYVMGARYESRYANNREEPEPSLWEELHYNQL
ncbi:hypothetical protein C8A01DRAFT_43227 [Parachaetomium inaequale]|uniref:F-box domain-containing protein n=1 Tax=Parachaetomium inaequale TaxID=2588326 RepID=A0AAN6SVK0_9PEZI|nr:hypothetical protein C8A01DRAFT_43227 [Parachaetomium inaequale]